MKRLGRCRASAVASLLTLFLLSGPVVASSPIQEGVRLRSFAFVISNPDVVFAGGGGIYRSADGGRTWQAMGAELDVDQVLTDPHDGGRVLAYSSLRGLAPGSYLESVDGGASWTKRSLLPMAASGMAYGARHTHLDGLALHGRMPGHWVALYGGQLYATRDAGSTWAAVNRPQFPFKRGTLGYAGDAFYVASSTELWRSEDGQRWTAAGMPDHQQIEAVGELGGSRLAVRTAGGWKVEAHPNRWEPAVLFGGYERRQTEGSHVPGGRNFRHDDCYPRASPADPAFLFVTCTDRNRLMSGIVDFSAQLVSVDGGANWQRVMGLPKSWYPTAVGMHSRSRGRVLIGWASGRVFRSDDSGATWTPSDDGLRFPKRLQREPHLGLVWLRETPLIRAVLEEDREAVTRLLAEGVEPNAVGVMGRTALEWVTEAATSDNLDSYWMLRRAGARVPVQNERNYREVFLPMASLGRADMIDDLLNGGWSFQWPDGKWTVFGAVDPCPGVSEDCATSLAGRPLAEWVRRYLRSAERGTGDRLVLDLVRKGQGALALEVAAYDSGHYPAAASLRLLRELPATKAELRRLAARADLGKSTSPEELNELLDSFLNEPNGELLLWALSKHRHELKETLGPRLAGLVAAGDAAKVRRALHLARVRLDPQELISISKAVVESCNPHSLNEHLAAGFPLPIWRRSSNVRGPVETALLACREHSAEQAEHFIARLHAAGVRGTRAEWVALGREERAVLLRSQRRKRYARFERPADLGNR